MAVCDGTIFPATGTSANTRTGVQSFLGQPLPVSWVEIEEVDPAGDTVRVEAQSKGAALFSRGEGMWYADGLIYFVCTGGEQFVVGVDDAGDLFKFARNNLNTSEFCGACFSNDGRMMFLNVISPGITYAIYRDDHRPIFVKRPPR